MTAIPGEWRCHVCGEVSKTYPASERHADATGHTRVDCVLVRKAAR